MEGNLYLALTLRVNHADGEDTIAQPIARRTEQARTVAAGDFHLPTPNRDRVMGCPPIDPRTRNSLCPFPNPSEENQEGPITGNFVQGHGNPLYVKVKMDGKPIGRKLDLNSYESYEALVQDLKNMFQLTIENNVEAFLPMEGPRMMPLRLLGPNADFIITYEDTEGDCMLVGDVPWKIFLKTVRRLRIKNTSSPNTFAEKCPKKRKST